MQAQLNLWLHLAALAVYAAATAALMTIAVPRARRRSDAEQRLQLIASALRIYDPLAIAALGVLVVTGAFQLTGYKAALGPRFFASLGIALAWKLLFAFLLINLAAYAAFGVGHRLVLRAHDPEPVAQAWLDGMLKRLQVASLLALLLVAVIVWISMGMTPGLPAPG